MLSERLRDLPVPAIRKLTPLATEAKERGTKIYHLNIGDPDIETPEVMLKALRDWDINPIGYAPSQGDSKFLESLKTYYRGLSYGFIETSNIQVTSGGSEALTMAMFATCEPGDEILVFEPFYTNYHSYAAVAHVRLSAVTTDISRGFHLPEANEIEAKISQKTKAILFCSPNNPTGTVLTKDETEMLVSLAKEHGLFLLSDEVYREFAFDGKKQTSLLSYMQEIPNQAVVLDSMSKRYSLCGLRLGTIVSLNKDLMAGVLKMAQTRLSSGAVDQTVAAKLTEVPTSYLENVKEEYQRRRDILFEGLSGIPGVALSVPEGAFYLVAGLPVGDAEKFCSWLLTDFSDEDETVMLAPASGFYKTPGLGKNEVRIAYVLEADKLRRCVELLEKALNRYTEK